VGWSRRHQRDRYIREPSKTDWRQATPARSAGFQDSHTDDGHRDLSVLRLDRRVQGDGAADAD
jgi:hypothetical protein